MKSFYEKTSEEGREIAGEVNDCVRSNPWRAVGIIAAVGGLLLGLFGCSQVILPEAFGDRYVR